MRIHKKIIPQLCCLLRGLGKKTARLRDHKKGGEIMVNKEEFEELKKTVSFQEKIIWIVVANSLIMNLETILKILLYLKTFIQKIF